MFPSSLPHIQIFVRLWNVHLAPNNHRHIFFGVLCRRRVVLLLNFTFIITDLTKCDCPIQPSLKRLSISPADEKHILKRANASFSLQAGLTVRDESLLYIWLMQVLFWVVLHLNVFNESVTQPKQSGVVFFLNFHFPKNSIKQKCSVALKEAAEHLQLLPLDITARQMHISSLASLKTCRSARTRRAALSFSWDASAPLRWEMSPHGNHSVFALKVKSKRLLRCAVQAGE